jgi:hypothetical protein
LGHHDFLAYGDDAKGQASTFVDAATGAQLLQQRYMELAKQGVGPLADSVKQATDAQMAYNTSLDAYTGPSQGMLANMNTLIPPLDNLAKSYLGLNDPLGQAALNITAVNKALAVPIGNFDADAIKLSTDAMARWKAQTDAALTSVQVGLDQTKFKWDALTGDVTDDQAWINLQQAFDDTKTKGTDAMETIAQRVTDLRKQGDTLAEAQKQAAIDDAAAKRASALQYDSLKLAVINYGKEVNGLPLEKVTSLKAELVAGELDRVENQLEILTRNRTVNLDIIAKGGAGYGGTVPGTPHAMGGAVTAGVTYPVGERGVELFTPNQSGYITPNSALRGMGGGGTTINYYVNVPPNYDKVAFGRLIEESRAANQRSGGTLVS